MKRSTLFVLFLLVITSSFAQHISTSGTEFWFGYMGNNLSGVFPVLQVQISSRVATNGTISIPGSTYTKSLSVGPNSPYLEIVPGIAENNYSEIGLKNGIKIETDDSVYVFAGNVHEFTTDASLILPKHALGTYYLVNAYYSGESEMLVVATEDNTPVEITPAAPTQQGRAANTAFTVTLNAGETYQVKTQAGFNTASTQDFTGSIVRSLDPYKPIAVFGGNTCADVPLTTPRTEACDHLYEQMFPVHSLGKTFYTIPLKTRIGDQFRIMATEDGTSVEIGNTSAVTIDKGKFIELTLTNPGKIIASKPVSVAQYSTGTLFDNRKGDPFMMMLLPVEQNTDNITFSTLKRNNIDHYVNIYIPTSHTGSVTLNGTNISSQFTTHPQDPAYSYAQVTLALASNITENFTLEADTGFNAVTYGFGDADSYGFAAGGHLDTLALTGTGITLAEETFSVFPNPSNGIFTIDLPAQYADVRLKVINIQGKEVSCIRSNSGKKLIIDLSEQPDGIYFCLLHTQAANLRQKIIISRN